MFLFTLVLAVFGTSLSYSSLRLGYSSLMSSTERGASNEFKFEHAHKIHALVTGGAGFIGSHCVVELLRKGYVVTILDNLSRGSLFTIKQIKTIAPMGTLRVVIGDLGDTDDVEFAFMGSNRAVDVVFHFAAVAHVGESVVYPLKYYLNITANTLNLLRVMDAAGVEKLVYSSTCATYGNAENLPITEITPVRPISPYGKSKLFAEEAIKDYAKSNPRFQSVILRYFNVVGSDPRGRIGEITRSELRQYSRISTACFDAALGKTDGLSVLGTTYPTRDGTAIRDFIHVNDLVDAHIAVAFKQKWDNPPSLYNVGTGTGVSIREFVEACKMATKKDISVNYQEEARPGDNAEVYASVDKIQRDLTWSAKYTNLTESLSHAWKWYKKTVYEQSNLKYVLR